MIENILKVLDGFFVFIFLLVVIGLIIFWARPSNAQDYTKWLDGCEKYRTTVMEVLEDEGVNSDYYYLMVAESRCADKAHSNKGAAGFWQLMPATAAHYGCHDPHELECATRAAAKYIKHLQEVFPTFNHVIAAYNMGGHNLKRQGMTTQAEGLVKRVNAIREKDNDN